ncbi:alpha/beta hydrolase [Pseudonocardia sp.]|jgi:pimeloyl-ACP methyl ester carboxylesterase|uniref:alpha/beta fold hydrolase n=1 Tax=Pseudonocardia sp. TaxID=60912 RepID=UPI0031FBDF16
MSWVRVRGFDCFVAEFGSGDSSIVLIHGWCSDSTDWVDQISAFAGDARVVTLDLRGHGHSERTASGYGSVELAEDVIAVLDHLGLSDSHLVGHSLGGIIANLIAVRRPDLARSVLLIDPAYGQPEEWAGQVGAIIGDPASADSAERAAVAADLEPEVHNSVTAARRIRRRLQALALGPEVVWPTYAGMWCGEDAPGLRPQTALAIRERRQPALCIYAYEPTYTWESNLVDKLGLDTRVELWTGVTHFLHQDDPERFNKVASAWFDTNRLQP